MSNSNIRKKDGKASSQQNLRKSPEKPNNKKKSLTIKRRIAPRDLSEKYHDEYIGRIFEPTKNEDEYRCLIYPEDTIISYKSIKRHIIDSDTHLKKVRSQDQELHDQLVEKLKASIRTKEKKQVEMNTSSRGYLEFLALCMKAKCSQTDP